MIKRHLILPLFVAVLALSASAQVKFHTEHTYTTTARTASPVDSTFTTKANPLASMFSGAFKHLDLGLSFGSTGIGLSLSTPVTDFARLRAGVDYIPRTSVPMTFDLMSYAGTDNTGMDEDTKFDKLSDLLEDFTGMRVDRKVDMKAHGTMVDFKLLVDLFPLRENKHWYATLGFYWGSEKVGHIENTITEAPSLMGVLMYNRLYDYFMNNEFYFKPLFGEISLDPEIAWMAQEKFGRYGRLGAHVGDFKGSPYIADGTPYMLVPDENGTIHADMYVNSFKPYLGVGFTTNLSKDKRWQLDVDAGALFWGKPKIYSHERYIHNLDPQGDEPEWTWGTITQTVEEGATPKYEYGEYVNLATDVTDIHGKVGTYCNIAKAMHVYPVLNLRISYKLF